MEEKTPTENLHEKFKHILELLTKKNISFSFDKEISEDEIMFFNGYMTSEGFEYDISESLLPELIEALNDYEFYEPDEKKIAALKEHMTGRVLNPTIDPFEEMVFNSKFSYLNEQQAGEVKNFIENQEKLKETLSTELANYTSNKKKHIRLVWNGTQTELAELFQVLINRGWLNPPQNKQAFVNTLCEMFLAGKDETMNKNILDYYHRDKFKANGYFSDIAPSPKKK